MEIFLVGGAVRDELLGLPVKDRDWVVVGATVAEMEAQGFKQPHADFPVFIHPESGEEYALARRETKTGAGYKGFATDASADVTLDEDLARRDLTINAIAKSKAGVIYDPFNGQDDLEQGWLRAIGEHFIEDPFRLLRICRFASRFGHIGFRATHATWKMMQAMSTEELNSLPIEKQWLEMEKALVCNQPWRYFLLLKRCGALAILQPELDALLPLEESHSQKDEPEWIKRVHLAVQAGLPKEERLAALLTAIDAGSDVTRQLGAGKKYAEVFNLSKLAFSSTGILANGGAESFYRVLEKLGYRKNEHLFQRILELLYALYPELKKSILERLDKVHRTMSLITAEQLIEEGVDRKKMGAELKRRRITAFEELS